MELSFHLAHLLNIASLFGPFPSLLWPADAFRCCLPIKLLALVTLFWSVLVGKANHGDGEPHNQVKQIVQCCQLICRRPGSNLELRNLKPDFLTPPLNRECRTAPGVKGGTAARQGPPSSRGLCVCRGKPLAAVCFPQVSAAVGTAGGQADSSVLSSPSQLAQGHENCQRKVTTSLEALLLFWGCSVRAATREVSSCSLPPRVPLDGREQMLGSWGSAWEMCSSGKVYGEHAACSFPGKSKSHLAASLLGLKEEAQTPRGACPLHPAAVHRCSLHDSGRTALELGGRAERTHAELSGGRPQTQESGALLIQQTERQRGLPSGSALPLPPGVDLFLFSETQPH